MDQLSLFDYIDMVPDIGQTVYFATCGEIKKMIVTVISQNHGRTEVRGTVGDETWILTKWYFSQDAAKKDCFYKTLNHMGE